MSAYDAYDLPTELNIGGEIFKIRYQWKAIIDILIAMQDPDLDDWGKDIVMLQILYPDWQAIPKNCIEEALQKAVEFIDCGIKPNEGKPHPRMYDWEQDAGIIMPEINKVAGHEVRTDNDLHWWTWFGYFMSIKDGIFAEVLNIRNKQLKGKKLEKYEQEYYRENKDMIDLKKPDSEEVKEEKAEIMKFL